MSLIISLESSLNRSLPSLIKEALEISALDDSLEKFFGDCLRDLILRDFVKHSLWNSSSNPLEKLSDNSSRNSLETSLEMSLEEAVCCWAG